MMHYGWWMACFVLLAFCGGCNSNRQTVGLQGEVSFSGRPIEKGRIDFLPIDGTPGGSVSAPIVSGRYRLASEDGVATTGSYRICIIALRATGKTMANSLQRGGPPIEVEEQFLPSIYNVGSTLKVQMADLGDKREVDVQLGKTPTIVTH
jgi:hypothetical protein